MSSNEFLADNGKFQRNHAFIGQHTIPLSIYTSHWSLSIGISTQANLVTDPYNALHMFV
jgi:hypothetical protein